MLLRICVILAILAGLGVIGVGQFVLRPQVEEIRDTRDANKKGWDDTKVELSKTKNILKNTSEELTKTKSTLEDTKGALAATTIKFETEQKRANGLQDDKNRLSASLKAAQDDLHSWTNLGLTTVQISALIEERKQLQIKNEGLSQEVKVFANKADKLQKRLDEIFKGEVTPPIPHTVRGKVLVVDPKWDFLVLDVGSKNDVVERGILLISRNGELVAKVKVMDVQDQRSIVNIMPGWKIKDVMEGDLVMAY
jgi:hypothetical protein